ncbi:MAG: hypothetical protein JWM82_1228 [Myxococcales bacterium]|nr:hypothetical protein [Myxococcales bacterium]
MKSPRHLRRATLVLALVIATVGSALAARPQPPVKLFPSTMAEAETVKVTLLTVPPAPRVLVLWGKKKLGMIAPKQPLILQRPRDSGPMDLILQSEGYVSVQTRAFTFADNKVTVKLTPLDQKNTLLGYRQELPSDEADGGVPAAPDAGVRVAPDAGGQ